MMDSNEYEGWFGIPFEEILNVKITTKKKKVIEENEKSQDYNDNNDISEINQSRIKLNSSMYKNFVSLKNNLLQDDEDNDNNHNNKIENTNNQNKINNYSIEEKNDVSKKEELNSKIFSNNNDIDNIIEYYFDDSEKKIIKYNGINRINNNNLEHYIYLNVENEFNSKAENIEFSWSIIFTKDTNFIGIGLADKYIVNQNHNKLIKEENANSGIYCLYSLYKRERKGKVIYKIEPNDSLLNIKYAINFTQFDLNKQITLIYNTVNKTLIFEYKFIKNKKEHKKEFIFKHVKTKFDAPTRTILTPCVIFYYPDDTIYMSKLKTKKI